MTRGILLGLVATGMLAGAPAYAAKRVDVPDKTDLEVTGANGRPLTFEETRTAVLVGARRRGWELKSDDPGLARFEYLYKGGKASATIEVPYKAGSYSIVYVSSHGLGERQNGGRRTIHSIYLRWVRNLMDSISSAAKSDADPPSGSEPDAEDADDKDPPGGDRK